MALSNDYGCSLSACECASFCHRDKIVDYFVWMCYNGFVEIDYLFINLHFFGKGVGKCIELTN